MRSSGLVAIALALSVNTGCNKSQRDYWHSVPTVRSETERMIEIQKRLLAIDVLHTNGVAAELKRTNDYLRFRQINTVVAPGQYSSFVLHRQCSVCAEHMRIFAQIDTLATQTLK